MQPLPAQLDVSGRRHGSNAPMPSQLLLTFGRPSKSSIKPCKHPCTRPDTALAMRMPKSGLTIKQLSLCWAGWHNLVPEYAQTTCDAVTRRLLYSIFTAAKNLKRSAPLWAFVLREHQSSTALSRRAGARASLELQERDHTRLPHSDSTKMAALLDFRGEQHHAISWADAPTITPIDAEPPRRTRSRTPPPRREPRV